jgi:hypothetical protein
MNNQFYKIIFLYSIFFTYKISSSENNEKINYLSLLRKENKIENYIYEELSPEDQNNLNLFFKSEAKNLEEIKNIDIKFYSAEAQIPFYIKYFFIGLNIVNKDKNKIQDYVFLENASLFRPFCNLLITKNKKFYSVLKTNKELELNNLQRKNIITEVPILEIPRCFFSNFNNYTKKDLNIVLKNTNKNNENLPENNKLDFKYKNNYTDNYTNNYTKDGGLIREIGLIIPLKYVEDDFGIRPI